MKERKKKSKSTLQKHLFQNIVGIKRLKRILYRLDIHLAACLTKNLFAAIIKKENALLILFHSGVYIIPMQPNNGLLTSYIGKTKR